MNFDITPYAKIRDELAPNGIKCGVNGRHQITISVQDREIWSDAGNSFWITVANGQWHLFTWTPVGYRIPESTDIPELCRRCMAIAGKAMYRVPKNICDDFKLAELDSDEMEVVFTAMETAK